MLRPASAASSERRPAVYYGWVMLTAASIAQVTSWGVLYYSFAVFIAPMQADLGWSLAALTGAYSLALLLSGVAAIPVGRWLDRHGPRGLMTVCSVAAALLVAGWASVDGLLGYYLIWTGIGLVMAGVLYEPALHIVANWFDRMRGRALTLLTVIGGLASVVYIPLASLLVDHFGWRSALLALAALLAAGTIPIHALLLRRGPADLGLQPDGAPPPDAGTTGPPVRARSLTLSEAARDPGFWWLAAAFFLGTLATMGVTVHLIPYLLSAGYERSFAAAVAGAIGLLAMPGRLIFTPLGSYVQRRYVTALIFFLQTASLALLLVVESTLGIVAFVILFGAGFGAITPARAALVAEAYGPAHYGTINGVIAACITFSRAAAPVGAGLLHAWFGGYAPVFWLLVAVSALASLAAWRARPPHRVPISEGAGYEKGVTIHEND